jgi:hypothetical protein
MNVVEKYRIVQLVHSRRRSSHQSPYDMSEELKLHITKLAADGSNWVTYRDRMLWAIDPRRWSDCLTSDKITMRYVDAGYVGGMKPQERWDNDEAGVKQLIASSISDTAFNHVKGERVCGKR